jgi:hypothetical protein
MKSPLCRVIGCLIVSVLLVAGSASVAAGRGWMRSGRVDPGTPAGLACPSSSLCVAVDASGNALISTTAGMGATGWRVAAVDPAGSLTAVSCPSARLCVAVDSAGRVLTSNDPADPASAWQSGVVESQQWASVSCPTVSLCVAVGGSDVAFSVDPSAGSGSWSVVRGIDQAIDYECAKYGPSGPSGSCPPEVFANVFCPTSSLCEAIDRDGGSIISTDPGNASGWQPLQGIDVPFGGTYVVTCWSGVLCLHDCGSGDGPDVCSGYAPGAYNAGVVVFVDPTGRTPARSQIIADSPLVGLWCTSTGCFAAPQSGGLVATGDPGDAKAWWQQLIASSPADSTPATPLAAVACPSATLCVALAADGTLLSGPPPTTVAQLRDGLDAALKRPPRTLRARALIRAGGYRERCRAFAPGTLTISWYQASNHVLVARAKRSFRYPAAATIKVALTRRGRRLIAHRRLILATRGTFAPEGTSAVRATGPILQTK